MPLVPAYARPTASSLAKAAQEPPKPQPHKSPSRKIQTSQNFRTAYISTHASRGRNKVNPFRFMDLPPDIRNMIYAYILPTSVFWNADIIREAHEGYVSPIEPWSVPTILWVKNKLLREEVGSFLFTGSAIVVYQKMRNLRILLKQIGRVNCERLAHNPEARFRWITYIRWTVEDTVPDRENLRKYVDVDKLWTSKRLSQPSLNSMSAGRQWIQTLI